MERKRPFTIHSRRRRSKKPINQNRKTSIPAPRSRGKPQTQSKIHATIPPIKLTVIHNSKRPARHECELPTLPKLNFHIFREREEEIAGATGAIEQGEAGKQPTGEDQRAGEATEDQTAEDSRPGEREGLPAGADR